MGLLIKTARKLEGTAKTLRRISKGMKQFRADVREFKQVCRESWHDAMAKQHTRMWLLQNNPERIWDV